MKLPVLSCGIFKYEFAVVCPGLEREIGAEVAARFLPPALDLDFDLLERTLRGEVHEPTALLYGCMCHPNMSAIADEISACLATRPNCAEMLISDEQKATIAKGDNVFFLTSGGLKQWRDIYIAGHCWDEFDARTNFGYIDRIVLLDSGAVDYTEEEIFDFYEFTQTEIEIEPITLDYFKQNVIKLCMKLMSHKGAIEEDKR